MKYFSAFLLLIVLAAGCGSQEEPAQTSADKTPEQAAAGRNPTGMNDPSQAQPGQSVRITPANPDDPKFKPDPKLGGGG